MADIHSELMGLLARVPYVRCEDVHRQYAVNWLMNNGVTIPVRCKGCKHGIWDEEEQMWECILSVELTGDADTYAMFHEYNDGEHFCSYGEKKDMEE